MPREGEEVTRAAICKSCGKPFDYRVCTEAIGFYIPALCMTCSKNSPTVAKHCKQFVATLFSPFLGNSNHYRTQSAKRRKISLKDLKRRHKMILELRDWELSDGAELFEEAFGITIDEQIETATRIFRADLDEVMRRRKRSKDAKLRA